MPRLFNADLIAAGVTIVFGVSVTIMAASYGMGSLMQPGPGGLPAILGVIIVVLGVFVAITAYGSPATKLAIPPAALRGNVFIVASMILWVFAVERIGFVPATAAAVFLSTFAVSPIRPLRGALLAAGLTAFGYFVFLVGLRIPLNAFVWN